MLSVMYGTFSFLPFFYNSMPHNIANSSFSFGTYIYSWGPLYAMKKDFPSHSFSLPQKYSFFILFSTLIFPLGAIREERKDFNAMVP